MPSSKKKRKNKKAAQTQDNLYKIPDTIITDDSDDSECEEGPFVAENGVKTNFIDEFDLFANFFRYLRKTDHILNLVKCVHHLSERHPKKLFESTSREYSSDPKFLPLKINSTGNNMINVSQKITIKFNKLRKRYIEAIYRINCGEALSIEKSLILTDQPNTTDNGYSVYRCHHCLRIISYFVTCPYCDVAIFCSYNCRNISWHEYHVWECYGLQKCFWDISSPEYLGMRILFLGAKYEFDIGDEEFQEQYDKEADLHITDEFKNIYKFLYRCTFNLKNKSKTELSNILQKCCNILIYLVECTHFFTWFSKLPKFANMTPYQMYMYIGGLLVRHYGQAEMHRVTCDQILMISVPFFDRVDFVSAGIFVSEFLFSASCKPNAVLCIRDNIAILKATEIIEPGQKITVNWRPIKEFCPCDHCLRVVQLNAFVCPNCNGSVMPQKDTDKLRYRNFDYDDVFKYIKNSTSSLTCKQCETKIDAEVYENLDKVGQCYITQFKCSREIHFLQKAIEKYKPVFQPCHIFYTYLYIMTLEYYISNRHSKKYMYAFLIFVLISYLLIAENPEELADILRKYLVIIELHFGRYSKTLLYGRCSMLLQILDMYKGTSFPPSAFKVCRSLLQSIKLLGDFHCITYKINVLEQVIQTNYKYANLY